MNFARIAQMLAFAVPVLLLAPSSELYAQTTASWAYEADALPGSGDEILEVEGPGTYTWDQDAFGANGIYTLDFGFVNADSTAGGAKKAHPEGHASG